MPPRYAYWTILIDGKATAFRAREREELLPTFNQLARKNADIVMRYFARGRLWDTPEQAQWASRNPVTTREPRDRAWRPGGTHKDPRARFERKSAGPERRTIKPVWSGKIGESAPSEEKRRERPKWHGKPGDKPSTPTDQRKPRFDAPGRKPQGRWNRPPKRKPR